MPEKVKIRYILVMKNYKRFAYLSFALNNQEQSMICKVKHFFEKNQDFLKIGDKNWDF